MELSRKKPEVTTAIVLETRVTKKDETHPVKLRITFDRVQKYYTISKKSFTSTEFEKIFTPKPRGIYKDLQREFEGIEVKAIDVIDNSMDEFSFDEFEKVFNSKKDKSNTIQSYFESKLAELDEGQKLQTAISYRATKKSLIEFDPKFSFQRITPKYLKSYENWMIGKENTYTTIGFYLRNLRHILNRAIEKGVISQTKYPFGVGKEKYKIPFSSNTKKALKLSDIEKIFKYVPESPQEARAKAFWTFSYLSNGMNLVDIANLRFKNITDKKFKFIRQKTKDTTHDKKEIVVTLLPEIQNIIDVFGNKMVNDYDYIFPVFEMGISEVEKLNRVKQLIKNTNKYISRIAGKIGLGERITTYGARHSYSTILKNSGASIEFISEQLGHSSTKVTSSYLDSFEDEQRDNMAKRLVDFKIEKHMQVSNKKPKKSGPKNNLST